MDRVFENSANKGASYPPYNIAQINDNEYMISIAVAGFGMDNLKSKKKKKKKKRTKTYLRLKVLLQKETKK